MLNNFSELYNARQDGESFAEKAKKRSTIYGVGALYLGLKALRNCKVYWFNQGGNAVMDQVIDDVVNQVKESE